MGKIVGVISTESNKFAKTLKEALVALPVALSTLIPVSSQDVSMLKIFILFYYP